MWYFWEFWNSFFEEENQNDMDKDNTQDQALRLLQTFNALSEGLLFMSEGDFPASSFFWDVPGASGALTPQQFLKQLVLPVGTIFQERELDRFFRPQLRLDDPEDTEQVEMVEKFKALKAALEENLNNIKVYRVGEIQIQAYVVGETSFGGYAGILTTLIET